MDYLSLRNRNLLYILIFTTDFLGDSVFLSENKKLILKTV